MNLPLRIFVLQSNMQDNSLLRNLISWIRVYGNIQVLNWHGILGGQRSQVRTGISLSLGGDSATTSQLFWNLHLYEKLLLLLKSTALLDGTDA